MGSLYSVNSTTGDITTAGTVISNTTTSGLLFPRLTTVQRNAIVSPTAGMQIYNTDTNKDEFYNGTVWGPISSGSGTPAGSNTQVQFNSSGAFGASADLTYDDSVKTLTVGSTSNTANNATLVLEGDGVSHSVSINFNDPTGSTQGQIFSSPGLAALDLTGNGTNPIIVDPTGNGAKGMYLTQTTFPNISVGINTLGANDASAVLEVNSTVSGFLLPRMSSAQRTAISSPATGLIVYDTDENSLYTYNGTAWNILLQTAVTSITGTGTVTPDARLGSTFDATVSGTLTLNGPTNGYDGQKILFRILNDASHSVTLATGSGNFRFGTDITSYTNSVSLLDIIGVIYNSSANFWDVVSIIKGF